MGLEVEDEKYPPLGLGYPLRFELGGGHHQVRDGRPTNCLPTLRSQSPGSTAFSRDATDRRPRFSLDGQPPSRELTPIQRQAASTTQSGQESQTHGFSLSLTFACLPA